MKFTLGGLMKPAKPAAPPQAAPLGKPAVAKMPAARALGAVPKMAGTLRLKRLPLSKVRVGGGY